jgi:hypothetical protein
MHDGEAMVARSCQSKSLCGYITFQDCLDLEKTKRGLDLFPDKRPINTGELDQASEPLSYSRIVDPPKLIIYDEKVQERKGFKSIPNKCFVQTK